MSGSGSSVGETLIQSGASPAKLGQYSTKSLRIGLTRLDAYPGERGHRRLLTADAPFAGGRPLGSLSTPPPRGICMQTVCRRCGEALITTGAARAGTLAAQNRQIWPLTPELISRLMTRTKSAGICRRPRTQSATTVLTLCSRAHAPDSRLCEIAVSCPAEIFRAHGQAGIIHYLALGRTVLTNTRGNASAARMGRPLSRHVRCLACGRVPVRRGRQGRACADGASTCWRLAVWWRMAAGCGAGCAAWELVAGTGWLPCGACRRGWPRAGCACSGCADQRLRGCAGFAGCALPGGGGGEWLTAGARLTR